MLLRTSSSRPFWDRGRDLRRVFLIARAVFRILTFLYEASFRFRPDCALCARVAMRRGAFGVRASVSAVSFFVFAGGSLLVIWRADSVTFACSSARFLHQAQDG